MKEGRKERRKYGRKEGRKGGRQEGRKDRMKEGRKERRKYGRKEVRKEGQCRTRVTPRAGRRSPSQHALLAAGPGPVTPDPVVVTHAHVPSCMVGVKASVVTSHVSYNGHIISLTSVHCEGHIRAKQNSSNHRRNFDSLCMARTSTFQWMPKLGGNTVE